MSFGSSAISGWADIYNQYARVTNWQHRFRANSEIRFQSTNEVRTSAGLDGVIIDDLMDDLPLARRAAREEPTLMEVWAD